MLCFKHMDDTIYGFLKNAKVFKKKKNPSFPVRKNEDFLGFDF